MTSLMTFMNGALVTWVGTFKSDKVTYDDLTEGVYLNKVMEHIDQKIKSKDVDYYTLSCSSRISNFERLLRTITNFYQTCLRQLIVMKLPDIVKIAKEPDSDACVEEMNKLLLLMLGCAVQSDQKERFVEKIKTLDVDTQEQLVEAIKLITDGSGSLFPDDVVEEEMTESALAMYHNIRHLVAERDQYYNVVCDIHQDLEYYRGLVDKRDSIVTSSVNGVTSSMNGRSLDYQRNNEMQTLRRKHCEQTEELEEKSSQVAELSRDLEERDLLITRLRAESSRLLAENKSLRLAQNDLDELRDRADLAELMEAEIFSLKQKVAEIDFYKTRVEELRVDNNCLLERRTQLETLLEKATKRAEQLIDDVVQYQIQHDEITAERDQLKCRLQAQVEDQALLEKERNKLISQLRTERDRAESEAAMIVEGPSLSEELMNTTFSEQVFQLQMENERLRDQVDRVRDECEQDAKWRCLELHRKIAFLQAELTKTKEKSKSGDEKIKNTELKLMEANRTYERLEAELSMVKDRHEAEVETLNGQMSELRKQIVSLRQRNCQENDVRYKEIETENVEMFNNIQNLSTQVNRLKFTNRFLRKSCDKLKEDVDRSAPYSDENYRLRTENTDLRRAAVSAKVANDVTSDLESRNLKLEIDIRKLKKLVNILKTTLSRVDPMNRISYHYITSL